MRKSITTLLALASALVLTACGGGGGGGDSGGGTTPPPPPPSGPGWTKLADLPGPAARFGIAERDGKIYVAGGYDTSSDMYIYDIAADRWQVGPSLPRGTDNNGAIATADKLYVFGGEAARALQIFDFAANSWSAGPGLPTVRFASVVAERNGKAHLIGGWNYSNTNSTSLADHERFDFASETHEPLLLAPLMTARNCAAHAVIDGVIYVAGGRAPGIRDHDSQPLASVEMYLPDADGWDVRADLPTARACAASAVVDGKLYVLGGELPAPQIHNAIERFDPATNTWEALDDMPYSVSGAGAVAVGDDIYVIGGYASTNGQMPGVATRYVYKYSPLSLP